MEKFKTALIAVLAVAVAGLAVLQFLVPPKVVEVERQISEPIKDSLYAQARLGYVQFDEDEFIRKYGSVYYDTSITYRTKTRWNVQDSIRWNDSTRWRTETRFVSVPVAVIDTLLPFQLKFPHWHLEANMNLHTEYLYAPVNEYKFVWSAQDGKLTDTRKWYQKPLAQNIFSGMAGYAVGRVHQALKEN